jgi:hypothetical protein
MANLLRGIAQGTKETVQQTAKDVGRKALSTMPSPSNAMYNLGLGVGPLIRNIVEASKEKPTKAGPEAPVSKKEFADVTKASVGQTAELLQLTRTSISLLRDIKTEMVKSNRAAGQSRRTAPARATGSVTARPLAGMIPGASYAPQDKAVATIKEKVTQGTDVLGTILSGLMAAGGAAAVFQLLPDNIKSELGKSALQFANTVGKDVIDGVGGLLQKAWAADSTATAIAAIAVAKVTGLLGVATNIAKGTLDTGKGIYQLGKAIATPTVAPTPAPAPTPTVPKPVGPPPGSFSTANLPGMQGPAGPTSPLPVGPKPVGPAPGSFSTANLPGMQGPAGPTSALPQPAAAAAAADVAAAAPGSKALGAAKTIGKIGLVGTAVSLGKSGYDYYQTGEAEKKGQITGQQATVQKSGIVGEAGGGFAAGLYGTGKGALVGSAFGPVGTIVGGVVGGVAGSYAGSKLGKYVGERFGKVKNFFRGTPSTTDGEAAAGSMPSPMEFMGSTSTPSGAGTQGPAPSMTQPSGGIIPGIDNEKVLKLIRGFESTNNYGADNKVGFIGAYQLGSQALETLGLMKPGSSKGRTKGANAAVYDPSAWVEGYSLQKFLQDKELQDKTASGLLKRNYDGLVKSGTITTQMSESDIASRLYAAWAGGTGGADALFLRGENRADFHFKGVGTASAAKKMAAAYGATPSIQGTMTAGGGPSTISPQSVQTASSSVGNALAQQQDMYSAFVSAMAGENVTVNLSQVVQNAMSDSSRGTSSPSPAGPPSRGAALDRAHKATG